MILEDMRIQAYVVISRYSRTDKFKGVFIKNLRPEKNNSKQICYCHQFENQILHRNFIVGKYAILLLFISGMIEEIDKNIKLNFTRFEFAILLCKNYLTN